VPGRTPFNENLASNAKAGSYTTKTATASTTPASAEEVSLRGILIAICINALYRHYRRTNQHYPGLRSAPRWDMIRSDERY
jgi:hypothetical protein